MRPLKFRTVAELQTEFNYRASPDANLPQHGALRREQQSGRVVNNAPRGTALLEHPKDIRER